MEINFSVFAVIAFYGIVFGLLNVSYDVLCLRNKKTLGGILIAVILGCVSIIVALVNPAKNLSALEFFLLLFFLFAISWGFSYFAYKVGINNGKKYWRNHVEKFYAYGIGIFIFIGISLLFIIGSGGSSNDEYSDSSSGMSVSEIFKFILTFSLFLLMPYWIGVFLQNQRQYSIENKKAKDEK